MCVFTRGFEGCDGFHIEKYTSAFLRDYFDFEELQPSFSSPYSSKRHEVLHAGYTSYLCSILPCKNLVFEQVIQTFVGGTFGCLLAGSHVFTRPQEWSNVCVPATLLLVLAVCTGFVNCFT